MLKELCSLNPDLAKLEAEGYRLDYCDGCLIVRHVPYLNENGEVKDGTLLMAMTLAGMKTSRPEHHKAFWCGGIPCDLDGRPLHSLVNDGVKAEYKGSIPVDHGFSCKKQDLTGYADYYEKVTTYTMVISTPALHKDKEACEKINNPVENAAEDSPFVYPDTNSSRAYITGLSPLMENMSIAIVGLGGTGSYLLDLLAKTPVKEIHLFDGDLLLNHNAFRAPGAVPKDILETFPKKVEYYSKIYSNMHRDVIPHAYHMTEEHLNELQECSFVFLCVDDKAAKDMIGAFLMENDMPFIDSGLGVSLADDKLSSMIRVTTGYSGHYNHVKRAFDEAGNGNDEYKSDIQIAELNAMAAMLMIVRWKQLVGFYTDNFCSENLYISVDDSNCIAEK